MNPARRLLTILVLSTLALALTAAQALASPKAYALNYNTDSAAVIDTQTNQIVGTIPVGSGPYSIAITPDGKTAYVGNENDKSVTVIDLQSAQVVGSPINLGAEPRVIAISPDGKSAYVTTSAGSVSVIDTQTNQIVGTIPVESGTPFLWGVAFRPDGKLAYVLNEGANSVAVVDTQTRQVVGAPIPVGETPINIALTPDGKRAYVGNEESNNVSVIDTQTQQNVGTIPVGGEPWGVAITPDGKKVYVSNLADHDVSVIDTQTNQVVGAPIPVGEKPYETAITPDGKTLYVASYGSETISVIDTQTNQVKTAISDSGGGPWQIVVAPDKSPIPSFKASQSKSGGPVTFNGLTSSDSDGSIASFDWSFGDGATAVNGGPTPSHRYAKAGTYDVGLSVTDNEGCSISLVFTGRTAYCSGSGLASQAIKVLPSNRFRFGKLKKNPQNGTATLQVKVPAAGELRLSGKKVRSVKKHAAKAGKVTLLIRPTAEAGKALQQQHRLKVHILVKFKPTGGNPRTKGKTLTLIQR